MVLTRIRRFDTSEAGGRVCRGRTEGGADKGQLGHGISEVREGAGGDLSRDSHRIGGVFGL